MFKSDISSSLLTHYTFNALDLNKITKKYDNIFTDILNKHAPTCTAPYIWRYFT